MTGPTRPTRTVWILLVEDSMDEALLVRTHLRNAGSYEVLHAQDGDRAIRLLSERPIDLVLTDLNLPGADGFDVIRAVKSRHPETPVIASTGYTNPQYSEEAFRAGADAVLHKPVDPADLLTRVVEALPDLHETAPERGADAVLAVAARPGDAEVGCGGALLHAGRRGSDVLLLVLSGRLGPGPDASAENDGAGVQAARDAAERLGARLILADREPEGDDAGGRRALLQRIAKEIQPVLAFTPTLSDDDPGRREAHRLCRATLQSVPNVLAYATSTATLDFRPTRFHRVDDVLVDKLHALAPYIAHAPARPDLSPRFVQSCARWWGRFADWGDAEPFEVLKEEAS